MKRLVIGALLAVLVLTTALPAGAVGHRPALRRRAIQEINARIDGTTSVPDGLRARVRRQLRDAGGRVITGTGTLTAEGRGRLRFFGSGTATIKGKGSFKYKDLGGDAKVTVDAEGRRHEHTRTGVIHYHHFDGSATISGSRVLVKISGVNISATLEGSGAVSLRGRGSYTANGREGRWGRHRIRMSL